MNTPANFPDLPNDPHSHELARYARELLALSGVPTQEDELWNRLDLALDQLEKRLTRGRDRDTPGKKFVLKHWPVRRIEALAEHFQCSRPAIIRQLLRQCPVESFPDGWVADDTRLIEERVDHMNQLFAEQRKRVEETR